MDAAKIIRLVALLVAIVAAFVPIPEIALILAVLGLAVGFTGVPEDRRMNFMVLAIALSMASGALGPIPAIGEYLTSILGNISAALNAGVIAILVMVIKDRMTE